MKINIIITGYRGTGKTTIGRLLSRRMKMKFIDTDKEIERIVGMKIPEIVKKYGWGKFRAIEAKVVNSAIKKRTVVIATGAGALVENKVNVKELKNSSFVLLLTATQKDIISRVKGSKRPSLTGEGTIKEIKSVLKRRKPKYAKLAEMTVDTSKITPETATIRALVKVWLLCNKLKELDRKMQRKLRQRRVKQ